MAGQDDGFEPLLGRMRRDPAGPRIPRAQRPMLERIARAGGNPRRLQSVVGTAPKAASGRFNARGRGAKAAAGFPSPPVWSFDRSSGQRVRMRRVLVKARIVKLAGKDGGGAKAHLRYLERDGTTRDGEPGRLFSTFSDEADRSAFIERGGDDRHQFRFIVSPEDGAAYETLKPFARDLMAQLEQDLGTTLDWVAVEHHDTGHPHVHIVLRGVTEDGKTLNIAGDYIAHGIRHRAGELITRDLGPETEREVERQLEREVDAERLTRLDRRLWGRAEDGVVDLSRPSDTDGFEKRTEPLLVARARKLEMMGLAEQIAPHCWSLASDAETVLQEMGRRGDIIRTMHAALSQPEGDHSELYRVHDAQAAEPIVGRVAARGLADELNDQRYLIVEGIDGHTHYAGIGDADGSFATGCVVILTPTTAAPREVDRTVAAVAAANDGRYSVDHHLRHDPNASERFAEAHVRRLEAIRRATGAVERQPDGSWTIAPDHLERVQAWERTKAERTPYVIETATTKALDAVARLDAPTWLDRQLSGEVRYDVADQGFGHEVKRALDARRQWLIQQGLPDREAGQLRFQRDLMTTLRRRELFRIAGQLGEELKLDFTETKEGASFSGVYRRSIEANGGRYALIEKSREFTLVPWRPEMDRQLGRPINVRTNGASIEWTLGRDRDGPQI